MAPDHGFADHLLLPCGEAYTDEATTRELEKIVEKARRAGLVVIQEYPAGKSVWVVPFIPSQV